MMLKQKLPSQTYSQNQLVSTSVQVQAGLPDIHGGGRTLNLRKPALPVQHSVYVNDMLRENIRMVQATVTEGLRK